MNLQQRLSRLEKAVKASGLRSVARGRRLIDLNQDDFWSAIEAAILPESGPVVEEIFRKIEDDSKKPPRLLHDGTPADDTHGFVLWMRGLQAGWCTLPDKIPHAVLLAYRDWEHPNPFWRCADCWMALPHNTVEYQFRPCPICGGVRLFHSDLGYPLGKAWIDPR
jgi:hypothetical protein